MTYKKQIIKEMQSLLAQLEEDNKPEPKFKALSPTPFDGLIVRHSGELSNSESVKPKFKVGDWVKILDSNSSILKTGQAYQISKMCANFVEIQGWILRHSSVELTTVPEPEINWNVRPKFKGGDICWKVTWDGGVIQKPFAKYYLNFDLYRTRTEAEWYAEQRKLIIEMEDFIGFDDLDWNDIDQGKWNYQYNFDDKKWDIQFWFDKQLSGLFPPCPSEKIADKTFNKFKDRLHYLSPYDGRNE